MCCRLLNTHQRATQAMITAMRRCVVTRTLLLPAKCFAGQTAPRTGMVTACHRTGQKPSSHIGPETEMEVTLSSIETPLHKCKTVRLRKTTAVGALPLSNPMEVFFYCINYILHNFSLMQLLWSCVGQFIALLACVYICYMGYNLSSVFLPLEHFSL